MSALYLKSQRKLFDIRDRLVQKDIRVTEADLKPTDRFLMERFITASVSIEGSLNANEGFNDIIPSDLHATEYRPQLNAVSVDIETDYHASTLYSIGIYSNDVSIVYMVGPTEDSIGLTDDGGNLELHQLNSEREVISAFVKKISDLDPDVIMGWNIVNFDLRCLQDFCDRLKMPLLLGRNNEAISWRKARDSNDRYYALLPGRVVLDGIELMRSATYQIENFSLEYVSRQLLDRGKLVEDVDQRGAEITELFNNNKPALARYNLEDCRLVWDIFQKEALISFAMERSLLTGLELDRYGGSVAAFDFLYLPRLHRKGFVAPFVDNSTVSNVSPGGYVMGSIPGIHQNVIVLDFKSLYPSIIRTFHVDPLALAVAALEENPIEGYDGGKFSREEFILPELISTLWTARDKAKASKNAVLSQAIKIIMNSFYGILGTVGCRFLDSRLVSSITKRGHEILIQSKYFIEDAGYQAPAEDGSSVSVKVSPQSQRLQLLEPFPAWTGSNILGAKVLIKAQGKCTTDHISMAGPWLRYRGHLDNIANNTLIGAQNAFSGETNKVLNQLTGEYGEVPAVQRAYKAAGVPTLVVGDHNYGEGSSREHAAMQPRHLGVCAVLVKSFARIHETNLKKQGMLALTFAKDSDYDAIGEHDSVDFVDLIDFAPGKPLTLVFGHQDGSKTTVLANHSYNAPQILWFKAGSALNMLEK